MNLLHRCPRPRGWLAVLLTASLTLLWLTTSAAQTGGEKSKGDKGDKAAKGDKGDKGPKKGEKVPLTHKDYDIWHSIQGQQISPDGRYVAYTVVGKDIDAELYVKDVATGKEFKHSRGRSPAAVGGAKGAAPPIEGFVGGKAGFSADSKHFLFTIAAPKADPKKEGKDPQRQSLGIMTLADKTNEGKVTIIPNVRTFMLPEESGEGVLIHKYAATPPGDTKDAPGDDEDDDQVKKGGGGGKGPATPPAIIGDLVIMNLITGKEAATVPDVTDFTITREGAVLICNVKPKDDDGAGVYAYAFGGPDPDKPGSIKLDRVALAKGKARYSRMIWDENQRYFAFMVDTTTPSKDSGKLSLYLWDRKVPIDLKSDAPLAVEVLNSNTTTGLKDGCVFTDRGGLSFTEDGAKILIGVAPPQPVEKEATGKEPKEEKAVVELWHWKDDFIQPMQKVRGNQDKLRTYTAVYHISDKRLVQIADKAMPTAFVSRDGKVALGSDDQPYRPLVAYDGNYADIYIVSTWDGSRRPLLKKHRFGVSLSPSGRYALFWDGKDWNSVALPGGTITNITKDVLLTKEAKAKFWNEDFDAPSLPPAYGVLGWTNDEYYVLLYDKYDVFEVSASGNGFRNLTQGIGRKASAQFRHVKLDPKEKSIDMSKPMLLRYEDLLNRDTGFALLDPRGSKGPQPLAHDSSFLSFPTKAKRAGMMLLTAQKFYHYPDLFVTGPDFKEFYRVSDVNPHKDKFIWGKSEMVYYKSADGTPLQGVLIKPENFDPTKKYPMIVYIYERLSQNLHHFVTPKEGTSINPTFYASNGYLVLMPDIAYTIGSPGQSALKCVLPAIQAVCDMRLFDPKDPKKAPQGFVDENAIGIQGHSWGGYQIAYMVTQTGRFKCAAAGAPVSNMTSAYDGIRWGSGLPRQFQYEKTQSRIGGSLWEYPMRFIENSPVFMADRVKTPLMILHNDQDDAVPWTQGIELYLALRRLGKEVYLFNYPGEKHGLTKKVNQLDYTMRMQQFFDHHLKGAPRPDWMEKGIPYTPRGPGQAGAKGGDRD
jgi:dienelactone hydrolase